MEQTIVKIRPEWNGSHMSLPGVDYVLPGWAAIPERLMGAWEQYQPFANIVTDSEGNILDITEGIELRTIVPLAAAQAEKLTELSVACNEAIVRGCDVALLDGTRGHISLTAEDQINLTNAVGAVQGGAEAYPYHLDGQLCGMYPAADILAMGAAATAHKLYHTTLFNHLKSWVRRCETSDEVVVITYDSPLPADLQANMDAILSAMRAGV